MSFVLLAVQLIFLSLAYVPYMSEPVRGTFFLVSFWCCGVNVGLAFALARRGGEGR